MLRSWRLTLALIVLVVAQQAVTKLTGWSVWEVWLASLPFGGALVFLSIQADDRARAKRLADEWEAARQWYLSLGEDDRQALYARESKDSVVSLRHARAIVEAERERRQGQIRA